MRPLVLWCEAHIGPGDIFMKAVRVSAHPDRPLLGEMMKGDRFMRGEASRPLRSVLLGVLALVAVGLPAAVSSAAAAEPPPSVVASFEGRLIRLADGWGEAQACTSDGISTRCYRSEQEMDAAEAPTNSRSMLACTPSVRVYRLSGWSGGILEITTHFVVTSLSPYGFDNDTSSYRIGSCNSTLYDTTTGGGAYPGNTAAGASASSMLAGWDNRIGSVYIT